MSKKVTFQIDLKVNGKDVVHEVSMDMDELARVTDEATSASRRLAESLIKFNQGAEMIRNISDSASKLTETLNSLTEESRTFSGAMAAANTMAGKSGKDFENLKDQVAELSKTIPIARDELANGLYQVVSNGVPEDNWIEYLERSAKASVGGIADLGETVKVTSTIIKNYGLDWSAAGEIQDKIQLTAKNGVTSFEQMAQALPRVTSQASNLGVTVDELMASFATLTGVSGNTAEVSTQLAAVFTALIKPSSEAIEMAQQLGIQFDAAAIKAAGGMSNFIAQLDATIKSYAQSTGMLEQEIYGKLFGSAESLRALTPLTNQLADKFQENIAAMGDSVGTIDEAFDSMADTGTSKLQMLNNKLGEVTDVIQSYVGNALPYLNFSSQILISISSVAQLVVALKSLGVTLNVIGATSALTNKIMVAGTVALKQAKVAAIAVSRLLQASFHGEAVGATTAAVATRALTVAIKGLLISTGVGIAIWALCEAISALALGHEDAASSANDMANAEVQAADKVKDAYEGTLQQTYGDLMAKYEQLKASWRALSSEQQKIEWIRQNQAALKDLGLEVNNVTDAEYVLQQNTAAVEEAFRKRAEAAAYAAKLTALYEKKIELVDKKNKYVKELADNAEAAGHNAKEGDLIPESYRNERYGSVLRDGEWHFSKEGAARYNGTSVSGNKYVEDLDKQVEDLNKEIGETARLGADAAKTSKVMITRPKQETPQTTTAKTTPTTKVEKEPDPVEGSIDYYEKEISDLRKEINATADEAVAKQKQAVLEQKQKALKDLKIRVGIEEAPKEEVKTAMQKLRDELASAQKEFDSATTIEARIAASAKVSEIQKQIDEATKGRLTIEAETEPTYVVQGSVADKRQSYSNAQTKASRIQEDFEIGLIGKEEAQAQIEDLNKQLESLGAGLKPLKIDVDSKSFEKAMGRIKDAWSGVQGIGDGITNITSALEGDKNAWEAISGVISGFISIAEGIQGIVAVVKMLTGATQAHTVAKTAEATATGASTAAQAADTAGKATDAAATVPVVAANKLATASFLELASASYFAAHAYIPFAGFGIASGFVSAAVAMTEAVGALAFATGGIVPGTLRTGDKVIARVNSGEMILNAQQQARLFAIANGAAVYGEALGIGSEWQDGLKPSEVKAQLQTLQRLAIEGQTGTEQRIRLKVRGRDLIEASGNELRSTRKRSNLR